MQRNRPKSLRQDADQLDDHLPRPAASVRDAVLLPGGVQPEVGNLQDPARGLAGARSNCRGVCLDRGVCECGPFYSGKACEKYEGCPAQVNETVCEGLLKSNKIRNPNGKNENGNSSTIIKTINSTEIKEETKSEYFENTLFKNNQIQDDNYLQSLLEKTKKRVEQIKDPSQISIDLSGLSSHDYSAKSENPNLEILKKNRPIQSYSGQSFSNLNLNLGNKEKMNFSNNQLGNQLINFDSKKNDLANTKNILGKFRNNGLNKINRIFKKNQNTVHSEFSKKETKINLPDQSPIAANKSNKNIVNKIMTFFADNFIKNNNSQADPEMGSTFLKKNPNLFVSDLTENVNYLPKPELEIEDMKYDYFEKKYLRNNDPLQRSLTRRARLQNLFDSEYTY